MKFKVHPASSKPLTQQEIDNTQLRLLFDLTEEEQAALNAVPLVGAICGLICILLFVAGIYSVWWILCPR